jgi:hypothetical protein
MAEEMAAAARDEGRNPSEGVVLTRAGIDRLGLAADDYTLLQRIADNAPVAPSDIPAFLVSLRLVRITQDVPSLTQRGRDALAALRGAA